MQTHRFKRAYHADRAYPIPVYRSYISHRCHKGRSYRSRRLYRSCRSMTPNGKHVCMCGSCRSYRPFLAKHVRIGRSERSHPGQTNCNNCTAHTFSTEVHNYENCSQTYPLPAKHLHVIEINQIPRGIQVEMIRNKPVSLGKLQVGCVDNRSRISFTSCTHYVMVFRSSHPARKCDHKDQADVTANEKSDTPTLYRPCGPYRSFGSCGPTHGKLFII